MRRDVYDVITQTIIDHLEKGVRPWTRPWGGDHPNGPVSKPLRANGAPYRGVNVIALWAAAMSKGYANPIWMTFKQAQEAGAHVRKGERGSLVVYANRIARSETDAETGEECERSIPFLKGYTVFNVEQIDGLPPQFCEPSSLRMVPVSRIDFADSFFAATRADIVHGGSRAYYMPSHDRIHMPGIGSFTNAEAYYATLAHEVTHWTGHASRLNREFGSKRWGDQGYAIEELVAELGAAFLSADLGLSVEPREDHAAYIASWILALKNDHRAIFAAAAHAQRAVDLLHRLQESGAFASAAA